MSYRFFLITTNHLQLKASHNGCKGRNLCSGLGSGIHGDRTTDVRPPGAEALGTAGRRGPGGSLHGTTGHGCTGVSEHLRAAVLGAPQYPGAYFQEPPGSHRRKKRKERKRNHQSPWPQALSFLQNKGLWCGEKTSQIILALPHPGPWLSGLTQGGERKGCWRRLLRVPWTARRSYQSILKEINPEYYYPS